MNVHGYMSEAPLEEMRLVLKKLKSALLDGLDDARTVHEKNEQMRKAWGYIEVLETHVRNAKKIIV